MEAARKGVLTEELKFVAQKEDMSPQDLMVLVAEGQAVIPCNFRHKNLLPRGIGHELKTKVNLNLGTTREFPDHEMEIQKAGLAVSLGVDSVMDLSLSGNTCDFRRNLVGKMPIMVGSVPIYDAMVHYSKPLQDITAGEWLQMVRMHAEDGVDFMTIHAGLNLAALQRIKDNPSRIAKIVSLGGSIISAWMEVTGAENPFYEYFDELLAICREYDVTLSLGDACRPGSVHDASDSCQIMELMTLGALTRRAWEQNVQVLVEGPGHMPMDEIETNMALQRQLCMGAPFYVLGPVVTDVAPGYDHITGAIGGALAAWHGASFLCCITPAEHLRSPSLDDIHEGVVAAKIAAHAGDLAKGMVRARKWDDDISHARNALDWERMYALAMEPEKPRLYREVSFIQKREAGLVCN